MANEIKGLVNISTGVGILDADARYVAKSGSTMTGQLILNNGVTSNGGEFSSEYFGLYAGNTNTQSTGINNTGVGYSTLHRLTTGSNNTAIGYGSLSYDTVGSNNTALGFCSLLTNVSGGNNTGIGYYSLYNNLVGGYNTALGNYAGETLTTGSWNTLLGWNAEVTYANQNYSIAIGYNAIAPANNTCRIGNSALVEVGTYGVLKLYGTSSGSASIKVAATAGTPADLVLPTTSGTNGQVLSTNGSGILSWSDPTSAGGGGNLWGKISNIITNPITGALSTPLLNRVNMIVSGPIDYNIDISSLGQAAGDVIAFIVKEYPSAPCFYTLDAGSGHKIAGRTRYLSLLHTNVVLLEYDGTDWQPLVLNLDTPFVEIGLITYMGGDTTNPTFNGGAIGKLRYRRVGNVQEMHGNLYQTTGGSNAGSGRYFLNLWRGQVDTNLCPTLAPDDSFPYYAAAYAIGEGDMNDGTSVNAQLQPIVKPFDGTSNRIYFGSLAYTVGYHYWSDSWFHATGQIYANFRLHLPMLNW